MNLPILSSLQISEPIETGSSVGFYVLLISAILFIYIKLNNSGYFKNLLNSVIADSNKFDSSLQTNVGNISSVFLQVTYLLLFALGFSYVFESNPSFTDYFIALAKILVLYTFQLLGFYLVSSIINLKTDSIVRNRLILNEIVGLFLFFTLILGIYLPLKAELIIPILLLISVIFNLIASSGYLVSKISNFHIILYLCILEIIPVLLLLKFI